jgi:hypothetical protein
LGGGHVWRHGGGCRIGRLLARVDAMLVRMSMNSLTILKDRRWRIWISERDSVGDTVGGIARGVPGYTYASPPLEIVFENWDPGMCSG